MARGPSVFVRVGLGKGAGEGVATGRGDVEAGLGEDGGGEEGEAEYCQWQEGDVAGHGGVLGVGGGISSPIVIERCVERKREALTGPDPI